ncbi:hypothetical protein BBF96_00735 [Anoxybacter fermentans]|uniref:ABC transporter domain-containing protein n=1 Tax=Anoxybacter fermentans TaxID=1323375 RepID=A0A3S9SUQ0_9FIRM|nr:ATP-binding cassette domain-containing protein [Anoxybacter fermentans]AZR72047.1 hypothetical protein BBF96_00735 [Anoxybacter fermentans]
MQEYIIKTNNLSKKFGDREVVKKLNLKIKKGEIYGLIGPNGAGRTTTILLLNGFYRPTNGSIYINNIDVTKDEISHKKNWFSVKCCER